MADGTKTLPELLDDLEYIATQFEESEGYPRKHIMDAMYAECAKVSATIDKENNLEAKIRLNCLIDRIKSNIHKKTH